MTERVDILRKIVGEGRGRPDQIEELKALEVRYAQYDIEFALRSKHEHLLEKEEQDSGIYLSHRHQVWKAIDKLVAENEQLKRDLKFVENSFKASLLDETL